MKFSNAPICFLWYAALISIGIATYVGKFDYYSLYFNKDLIFQKHEYWRLFTSLFLFKPGRFGNWVTNLSFLRYLYYLESSYFIKRQADFLLFIIYIVLICWLIGYISPITDFLDQFSFAILYYYTRKSPAVFLVFLFAVSSYYLPFIFIVLSDDFYSRISLVISFVAMHIYFFLHDVINLKYNTSFFQLPDFLNQFLYNVFSIVPF